jgi:hypothetical protein
MWDKYKVIFLVVGVAIVLGGAGYLSHHKDTQRQKGGQGQTQEKKEAHSGQLDLFLKEQQRRENANIKMWPVIPNEHLWNDVIGIDPSIVNFNLNTKWREGTLFYIFNASPFNDFLRYVKESRSSTTAFTIILQDVDGFVILKKRITLSQMTTRVDNKGEWISFEKKDSVELSEELYNSLSSWEVSWSGFQDAKEYYKSR